MSQKRKAMLKRLESVAESLTRDLDLNEATLIALSDCTHFTQWRLRASLTNHQYQTIKADIFEYARCLGLTLDTERKGNERVI
jgi:hypothetical protein